MLVDQFGRAAEGAATGKDLSARMLKDLRSKAKGLYSAAARDRCQLPKARVIGVHLRDKRGTVGNKEAAKTLGKMLGTAKN